MTLDQIKVLHMIVKTGSFRKASEKLNRAQSAVSYAISKLEDEIGFKIFTRDGWKALLTDKGRLFFNRSLQLAQSGHELSQFSKNLSYLQPPELIFCHSLTLPPLWLNLCLITLNELCPDSDIRFFQSRSEDIPDILRSGSAHLVFSDLPSNEPDLISSRMSEFEMLPVISAKTSNSEKLDYCNIQSNFHQIVTDPHPHFGPGRRRLRSGNQSLISVETIDRKQQLIESGMGWGYLPFLNRLQIESSNMTLISNLPVYHKTIFAQTTPYTLKASTVINHLWENLRARMPKQNI